MKHDKQLSHGVYYTKAMFRFSLAILRAKEKGAILIFSLIVLSFILVAGLSLATVALSDQKTATSTDRSTNAFQAADSGAEIILARIYSGDYDDDSLGSLGSCSGTTFSGSVLSSSYRITIYDNNENPLGCGEPGGDPAGPSDTDPGWRAKAVMLRSEGTYSNSTRAIWLVIEAPPIPEAERAP